MHMQYTGYLKTMFRPEKQRTVFPYEPHYEKTRFLHMQKQRRRSAAQ